MKYLLIGEETQRLKFRLVQPEDFNSWINLFHSKDIARHLDLDSKLSEHELCEIWFEKVFYRYDNNLGGMNALIDKKTNQLIGQCGLLTQTIDNVERLEIGYSILPEFWHQGFGIEAAIKCRNYAFENNYADSLISMIHIDNFTISLLKK